RDHHGCDLNVVADQVALGEAVFGEEQLIQVREMHGTAADFPIALPVDGGERLELAGGGAANVSPQLFRDLGRRPTEWCGGDVRGGGLGGCRQAGGRSRGCGVLGELLTVGAGSAVTACPWWA